jgi:O-antigen ligase
MLNPVAPFFVNPNQVGIYSVLAIGICLSKISSSRSTTKWKTVTLNGVLLSYVMVMLWQSGSRTGLVSCLVLLLVWFSLKSSRAITTTIGVLVLVLVTSSFLTTTFGINENENVRSFIDKGSEGSLMDSVRQNMIDESLVHFKERPLLGYGFGLSWNVQAEDLDIVLRTGRLSRIVGEFGNSTLAILIGGGLLLLICYYGLIFSLCYRSVILIYRLPFRDPRRRALIIQISVVAGLFANSQGEGWMISLGWPTFILWLFLGHMNSILGSSTRELSRDFLQTKRPLSNRFPMRPGAKDAG